MNIATETFLDNLRASTSESHKNLENLPLSAKIVSKDITKNDYGNYLSLMADVIHQMENEIYPIISAAIPDLEERRKLQSIQNDLNFLQFDKTDFQKPFQSEKWTVPFALGIFYVVEGSSLGGRFILKNIESTLGFQENGAEYFSGYGNTTGSRWKNFLNFLTAFEKETNSGNEIIAGADFAFKSIHNHLSK